MEVTTSIREEDGKTQVAIELTEQEVKKHIDSFFKDLAKNRIPGFRPGKAPRKVLERNFGGHEAIYAEITSDMVNEVLPLALDSKDVIFIDDPKLVDEKVESVEDGKPYTFEVYGEVAPKLTLTSVEPVEIEMPPATATDEEIEAQLESLRDYYYEFEEVDRAAEEGDYVMMSIDAKADGVAVDALNSPSRLVELGSDALPKELTDQVLGMKKDETKEFDFEVAEDDEQLADFKGKTIHAEVTVSKVQTKELPTLDEEFAKRIGFDTLEQTREEIANQINTQRERQLPELKERRCVEALAKRIEGEIPESYINYSRDEVLREFFNNLQSAGITFDQFLAQRGISADEFRADLDDEAKENAEQSLALDALFEARGMELTDADIDEQFQVVDDPAAARKSWEESGRMSLLREGIRRSKAAQWLIDNAIVTEEAAKEGASDN
ncbi:MAG: trigger factor [Coriobacteriaceae bacterium]|nr:trigger factor [Coriobacteriaceae bacterium]MDD7204542.1 trigger factor [Coriobacteriaceae bacterium]